MPLLLGTDLHVAMASGVGLCRIQNCEKLYILLYLGMKTSRTNSFRLQRLTNTHSLRKTSQTFYNGDDTFKLAAINSVSRGVKYHDISLITGPDLRKLRKEPTEGNEGFYESAHQTLTDMRKRHDEIKRDRMKTEDSIFKLKQQHQKYLAFSEDYGVRIKGGKQKVQSCSKDLSDKKRLVQSALTERKVLLYMQDRHKKDKIFYDQKRFDLEKELSFLTKQLQIFLKEGKQVGEGENRAVKVFEKLTAQLQSQRSERRLHLKNLQIMIEQKQQCLASNQIRESELNHIAEEAMLSKDLSEKQWRKIFLTNVFVHKMLRNKIEKQMQKFRTVEFAFKTIKTATGVNDGKSLVSKYLSKQHVYGQLLGKIAQNERRIDFLRAETESLIREEKQIQLEKDVILSTKIKSQDLQGDLKQLNQVEDKQKLVVTQKNKLMSWVTKQMKKFNSLPKQIPQEKTAQLGKENLIHFLNLLDAQISKSVGEVAESKFQGQGLSNREVQKLTRIQPRRARKNSIGQEVFDVDQEEVNLSMHVEQTQVLSSQREELIRANQKFMKEVKRKKDEERRSMIDRTTQKKEKAAKAPEPKHQDD